MKRFKDSSNNDIDLLKWAQRLALVLVALVAAAFLFNTIRGMVRTTNLVDLPGFSIKPTQAVAETTPGEATEVVIAPPDTGGLESLLPGAPRQAGRVNILVMGLDKRDWEAGLGAPRTDTMMVLTIDLENGTAGMLSLPRDLWVNIPGFYFDRINEAYSLGEGAKLPGGGAGLAVRTVEEFLGIDIHYYAQIDFNTFIQFIDYIGKLRIEVYEYLELEIPNKKVDVPIEPGVYVMRGEYVLAYVRNRYTEGGDVDRAARQQQVIIAIRDKLLEPQVQKLILEHAAELWEIFSAGIKTNISFDDAFRLGFFALKINVDSIARGVVGPPDYAIHMTTPDGKNILKPITASIRTLRDEMFADDTLFGPAATGDLFSLMKAENAKVAVYNGSGVAGLAGTTQEYLLGQGLNVIEIGNFDYVPATTVYDYTGNPYTVMFLIDLMGIQPARIFSRYDPTSSVDVAVVLGSDWAVP